MLCSQGHAQTNNFENITYNVGIGSIGSAIGAVINKKADEKTGKVILRALWKGGLGGAIVFGSKKLTTEIVINDQLEYNWGAKILNSAGTSIIENAANNRDIFDRFHINLAFNRIEFHTPGKLRVRYKVLPVALGLTIFTAVNSKFETKLSLQS